MSTRTLHRTELDAARASMAQVGFHLFASVVDSDTVDTLRHEVLMAVERERTMLGHRGAELHGRLTLACMYGGGLLRLLNEENLFAPVDEVFGEFATLYTMTTSCIAPGSGNYTARIHRDTRHLDVGTPLNLGIILLLDDFNAQNGATEFLPGSFTMSEPGEAHFAAESIRLDGRAGDLVLFDTRLWHRSGANRTDRWRSCVLFSMVRPWMRQRFDMARMLHGTDLTPLQDSGRRRLGLDLRAPGSINEFISGKTHF
jgi:hypothetical protein